MSLYQFKPEDAYRFAREQGIDYKTNNGQIHLKICPYCHGGPDRDTNTFAISAKTGQFKCLRTNCGADGNMITLHKDFGFDLGRDVTEYEKPKYAWRRFKNPEEPYKPTNIVLEYMNGKRKISPAVLNQYEITTGKDPNAIMFFFYDEEGIGFIKRRYIDPSLAGGNKEKCEYGMRAILFGMKQCNLNNKTLVITEGQIDSLSVATAGIENAVSVPTGAKGMTWVPHCWDWLHNFNRVIVFGDMEHGSMTLLDDIKRRFTWMQVLAVRERDYLMCKDANEILIKHGPEAVAKAVQNARPVMSDKVIQLADVDYSRKDKERLPIGLKRIDYLLLGGIPFGGTVVLSGKRGEGKTTEASMIIKSALEHDYNVFLYSGEMIKEDVRKWLDLQIAGPDFIEQNVSNYGYTSYTLSKPNKEKISAWIRDRAYIFDDSYFLEYEETTESLLSVTEQYITQFGCKVVMIDNLMTAIDLEKNQGNTVYEIQSNMCKKLARLARRTGAMIIIIAHQKKGEAADENDKVSGTADITNLASVVFTYERSRALDDDKRIMKVVKNRDSGRCDFKGVVLGYDPISKRIFGEEDDPKAISPCFADEDGFTRMEDYNEPTFDY